MKSPNSTKIALIVAVMLACAAVLDLTSCGGSSSGVINPPPPSCPTIGAVTLDPITILVGGTSSASAPAGFTGGNFSSSDPAVATVSGSAVKGMEAGSATITGSGWTYSNGATGCSLTGATLTVTAPPVVSISISDPNPLPTTVGSGEMVQFEATVTGSSNVAVTWTATPAAAGTINATSGLFTAAALATNTSATVTATAAADTTKSATVTFTITGASTITSIAPWAYYCDAECNFVQIAVKGFGFMLDYIKTIPDMNYQGTGSLTSNGFDVYFGLDTDHTSEGPATISDCRTSTTGCSNPATFLQLGNQNLLATDTIANSQLYGEVFNLDRAAGAVWKFKSDGSSDGSFFTDGATSASGIPGPVAITFDDVTGWIWTTGEGIVANDPSSGAWIGLADDSNFTNAKFYPDVAAKNGIVCVPETNVGLLACFVGKSAVMPYPNNVPPTFYRVSAGTEPWSLAMYGNSSQTLIAVIDRATPALYLFSATLDQTGTVITYTELGSVPLPFSSVGDLRPGNEQSGTAGGWYVKWLAGGGTIAVKGPVLNTGSTAATDILVFVGVSTDPSTSKTTLTVSPAVELPPNSFRMIADFSGHAVDVESVTDSASDPAPLQLTISQVAIGSITPGTIYSAVINPATATSGPYVGVGFGQSLDGQLFYTAVRSQCATVTPSATPQ